MDYSVFEVYNASDETMNFGARSLEDDNLYETCTLSTLSVPIDEDESAIYSSTSEPNVRTSIKNGHLIIVVNSRISVLSDLRCSALIFTQHFGSIIDCFQTTPDSQHLLLCLRSGCITGIDLKFGQCDNIQINENTDESASFFIEAFLEDSSKDVVSYLVVDKKGNLSRIIVKQCQLGEESMIITSENIANLQSDITTAAYSIQSKTLLLSGKELISYNVEKNIEIRSDSKSIKMCYMFNNYKFVALLENDDLCLISNKLYICSVLSNCTFKSIAYFLTNDGNFFISLSKKKESGKSVYDLNKFPEYQSIFKLNISGDIYLIPPDNIDDGYLYICNDGNGVLRICNIYETNPMQRLHGLLRKGKYDEAEVIAEKFSLSKTEIYKARLNQMVEEDILDETHVTILLEFLAKIDDVPLKLKICLAASDICEEFSDVQRILVYGCNLEIPKELRNTDLQCQQDVIEQTYLFETFMELKKLTGGTTYNMKTWINFIQINLIAEVQRHLNNRNFSVAILLYSRFEKKEFEKLTDKDIKKMLHSISSVPLAESRQFLCTFVPLTLRHKPLTALPIIVSWVRKRTQAMEHNFPESAIDLIKTILHLFKMGDSTNSSNSTVNASAISSNLLISSKTVDVIDDNSPRELRLLLEMLENIRVLRDEFDVNLPLAVYYMENNCSLLQYFLMIPMEVENYKIFLKEFVIPYMLKNNMNPDQEFLNEMKGVLSYEEKHWVSIVPAILSVFKSITFKLEAILLILYSVNPPWNNTIRVLAADGVRTSPPDHPLVAQIKQCTIDEPIQIVLSKHEYCIPKSANIADPKIFTKIIERIIYCMIENNAPSHEIDIFTLCATAEKRDMANLILAENFVEQGNVEKALTYVDAISNEEKISICQTLLAKAMNNISAGWFTDQCKAYWFEIFEPLMSRLELLMEPFLFKIRSCRYLKIRTLALIKTNFPDSKITLNDLNKSKPKDSELFLTKFLTQQFLENSFSQQKLNRLIRISIQIASTLLAESMHLKSEADFLLTICEESNSLVIIVAIAEFINQSKVDSSSSKTLSLIAILLMRNVGIEDSANSTMLTMNTLSQTMQNMSFCAMEEGSVGVDVGVNLRALQLALLLAEMSLADHNDNTTDNIVCSNKVYLWIKSMSDLLRSSDSGKSSGYRGEVPTMNTFNTIRQLTVFYCGIVADFNNPDMEFLSYYSKNTEIHPIDRISPQLDKLSQYIQFLSMERHHFTVLRVINAFQNCLAYARKDVEPAFRKLLGTFSKNVRAQVLKTIFTENQIDINITYTLLTQHDSNYTAKTLAEYLKLYKRNYQKLSQIADLGLRLVAFFPDQAKLRSICQSTKLRSKWIQTLQPSASSVSHSEFFTMMPDRLIGALINADCFANVATLDAFCTDFGLVVSDYFEMYIQRTLLSWRPQRGASGVIQNASKVDEVLYEKCMDVARLYKGDLFGIINSLWGNINCYYYEVFLSVIRILESVSPECLRENGNQKTLLHFLQEYRRVSKPGESELEEFFKRSPDVHTAEPLSEWRLPFFSNTFFSNNIMKILKPEINLNTYKKWFHAIPALKDYLNKDYICCYVIRSVVSSGALQVDKSHDWMLFSVHSDLFDEINECVTHIENLDMATSALYHLTIHTPPGADQVKAAELCYIYAKKLRESVPEETAENANKFEKVKVKYYGSRVNQILHTYDMATDVCLQHISDCNALIETIYMDPRILQVYECNISTCPDINEAAGEIAKLYEMDIIEKQKSLVEAWLFESAISSKADETVRVVFNNCGQGNFNDNFKRACYIFTGENICFWQEYLREIGMNEEQNTKMESHLTKARALKCLYTISSIEKIESMLDIHYNGLKNYVDKLFLLSDMEHLGYNISIEELNEMNKIRLLQNLTRHLDKNTTRIMSSICTTYAISDLKCWEFITNNFIKLEQYGDLKEAVSYLKDIQSFKYKSFYINAWHVVIKHHVNRLTYNLKSAVNIDFVNLVLMIQACPIYSKLNFSSTVEKFTQLGWWEFVAIFMQFINFNKSSVKKVELIKEIKAHCPGIEKRLDEYSSRGILVDTIKRMLNS